MGRRCAKSSVCLFATIVLTIYLTITYTDFFITKQCNDHVAIDNIGGGGNIPPPPQRLVSSDCNTTCLSSQCHEIQCHINNAYSVSCIRDQSDVFMPFTFVEKYFEVSGNLVEADDADDGKERFDFSHSYSKYYRPLSKYSPGGTFLSFANYNVESRSRVKCISGVHGVPLSTQWSKDGRGHYYPTQIGQYALSHYSKGLTSQPSVTVLEDGAKVKGHGKVKWTLPDDTTRVLSYFDNDVNNYVLSIKSDSTFHEASGVTLHLSKPSPRLVLSANLKFVSNGSVTVGVTVANKKKFMVHYVCSDLLMSRQGSRSVVYGIGSRDRYWSTLVRDLAIDVQKALVLDDTDKKVRVSSIRVTWVTFRGHVLLDNVTLSTEAHRDMFLKAADWLVSHQDANGGWPINVARNVAPGFSPLRPGWYSAMAQGQAMSALVRAHLTTKDDGYLRAVRKSLKLFNVPSQDGGVLATFMDTYRWYEEYPTQPSLYVLNGFMYALLGLYDAAEVLPGDDDGHEAHQLFEVGMKSLRAMLPLYDTGQGSVYDLRHFVLGGGPPNVARWDYHTTHINQLLALATLDSGKSLADTAERWIGYLSGKRAKHN